MDIKSLEIKNKTNYDSDNISCIDDFNVNSLRVTKLVLIFIILDVLLTQMTILYILLLMI